MKFLEKSKSQLMYARKEHKMDNYRFRDSCNKTTVGKDKYWRNHRKSKYQVYGGWDNSK